MNDAVKMISTEDLTLVMATLSSARTILADISVEYFDCARKSKALLALGLPAAHDRLWAVEKLLEIMEADLTKLGASDGYNDEASAG